MNEKKVSTHLKSIFETNGEFSHWFGYYNYDPLNTSHDKMLCNRAKFDKREIYPDDFIEVGWFDIQTGNWNHIDNTNAFNWQQGAMLQWMPNNDNKVIYNSVECNHYVSIIYDIQTGEKRTINWPIYCIMPNGEKALTLNYERSYWCRAYHYYSIRNIKYDVNIAPDDGIFEVDLLNNTIKRIVDINDVVSIDSDPSFKEKKHWLEHIMINPEGTRIVFLHRFSGENVYQYNTRVFTCEIDGSNLQIAEGWRINDWSHVGWKNENEFTVFAVKKGAVAAGSKIAQHGSIYAKAKKFYKTVISPILGKKVASLLESSHEYQVYRITDAGVKMIDIYRDNIGRIDGHPSFTKNEIMITDTYPDADNYQHLYAYNPESRKCIELASFFAPLAGNPASCDLHPKLCRDGDYLMVDSAYSGTHRMLLFNIDWECINKELE